MNRLAFSLVVGLTCAVVRGEVLQTFECEELFGANHPDQIVFFDLNVKVDPAKVTLRDSDGNAQLFQMMPAGRLALRTNLPAEASKRWTLEAGSPTAAPATDLRIDDSGEYVEITNQYTGIRIPKLSDDPYHTPCPIQGIRLRDGTWTAAGFNVMSRPARSMTFEWLQRGPLIVRAKVSYRYDRSALSAAYEPETIPAGEGEYSCTIELQSGQPVILFQEYSEVDVHWSVDVEHGLHPDRAQYRGHQARSVEAGRNADGTRYQFKTSRNKDALVDLDYTSGRINAYSRGRFPFMSHWDPWAADTGFYWQVYSTNNQHQNMLAIFHGSPSTLGGTGVSGVAFDTQPDGVRDLDSAVGPDGVIHMVYQHGQALRYVAMDASLKPGPTIELGDELAHPSLALGPAGELSIIATDRRDDRLVMLRHDGNAFTRGDLHFEETPRVKVVSPQAWHVYAGGRQFLLLYGEHEDAEKGLLFVRDNASDAFRLIHQLPLPPASRLLKAPGYFSQRFKPAMTAAPNGDLHVLFTASNGLANILSIPAGTDTVDVQKTISIGYHHGGGFDPATGQWFVADPGGELIVNGADHTRIKTGLKQRADPGDRGPNRRSMASSPDGQTAILVHSARPYQHYPSHRQLASYMFRRDGETWSRCEAADALNLIWARVHYLTKTGQFVLLGRNGDGRLAVYSLGSGGTAPSLVHEFADSEKHYTGLRVKFTRLMPTQRYARTIRFNWSLFTGYTADEVKPLDQVQGVGLQYNEHSGVNLTAFMKITGQYPDPPQGYGSLYVPAEVLRRKGEQLQAAKAAGNDALFKQLVRKVNTSDRPVLEFWREPTTERAMGLYEPTDSRARDYAVNLVNGHGVYRQQTMHFMAALRMSGAFVFIDQLLASGMLNDEQTRRLKLAAELYTACLWNDDVVPMQDGTNINRGLPNMLSMWFNTRHAYTLMLASHPRYADRAISIGDVALTQLHNYVNEAGAANGSTHYIGAAVIPIFNLMQQLQMAGVKDHFVDSVRLQRFAEFYMQQVTPPEIRFNGKRKVIAVGDGSTEFSIIHGQLGTGFARAHLDLSKRLMWVWDAMGRPHNTFFGSTIFKIDPTLPTQSPQLHSAHFDGWCSVLRYGFETDDESAVWLVNGDHYSDHRHDDNGSVVIYALGAPISVDWGPIYYPRVPGSMMHSMVVPESLLKQPWDADNTALNLPYAGARSNWWNTINEQFLAFDTCSTSTALFQHRDKYQFRRTVRLIHVNPDRPIILIDDSFPGESGAAPMVSTFNLMAQGAVDTPAGSIEPETRWYNWRKKDEQQMPSSTKAYDLPNGLHRFGFEGQWGVDFDLYVDARSPQQFALGNWGHNWHPSTEIGDFRNAHGRTFEERQHILRLRGSDGFRVMLLPRRDGENPAQDVQRQGENVALSVGEHAVTVGRDFFTAHKDDASTVVSFADRAIEALDVGMDAGPGEVVLRGDSGHALLVMSGVPRLLTLPAGWSIKSASASSAAFEQSAKGWVIRGQDQQTVRLVLQRDGAR